MPAYFEGLDEILGVRLQSGHNILVYGHPLSGKTTLGLQFIFSGLKSGEYGILSLTNETPEGLKRRAENFGWALEKYEQENALKFLDCFSKTVGIADEFCSDSASTFRLPGLTDLTGIILVASQLSSQLWKEEKQIRFVFDSLSSLFLYNPTSHVLRFLHVLLGRMKTVGAISLYVIESGVHSENVITAIKSMCDGVVALTEEGGKRYMECNLGLSEAQRCPIQLSNRGVTPRR